MAKNKKEGAAKKVAVKKQEQKKASPVKEKKVDNKIPAPQKSQVKANKQVKAQPVQAVAQKNPPPQTMSAGTAKKRLMVSYEKLPDEVIEVIRTKYPYGYNHDLKEVKGIDNKKFYVLPIELPDVVYLVKVDIRKPFKIQDDTDEEEDIFTPEEGFAAEEDNFPAEDLEQIEGEDEEDDSAKKKKKKKEDEDGDGDDD